MSESPRATRRYAARIMFDKETKTHIISFPDVRGAHSFGTSVEDALRHGRDALLSVFEILDERGHPIPLSKAKGKYCVEVPDRSQRVRRASTRARRVR